MLSFSKFLSEEHYDFYSTQVDLTGVVRQKIIEYGEKISKEDLFPVDGKDLETDPHVTVLYGLIKNEPDRIQELTKGFGPFVITFGKTSIFEPKTDYNVLKVEVFGKRLHDLHSLVKDNFKNS